MLDGLAFLPVNDVIDGMLFLRSLVPSLPQLQPLLEYFDATYVTGTLRTSQAPASRLQAALPLLRIRRQQPLFPPHTWNVCDATLNDHARTNNLCEAWNNAYKIAVGHCHPGLYTSIEAIRKEQAIDSLLLHQLQIGQPPVKRVRRESRSSSDSNSQFCCVFSSDFIGDLENYTFLKTRWYKQSENQCFHLHRYPHGGHLGFFKMAAGKCIFVHFSASKCH